MKVIVVATQKGGAGKTTLSGHIGVELSRRGHQVVLVDTDPQRNLGAWWDARETEQPAFLAASHNELAEALPALAEHGYDFVVVDTPPQVNDLIRTVIKLADLVVIPAKPSPHDLRAVGRTVDLVEDIGKPMVFVLNEVKAKTRLEGQSIAALSQHGKVAPIIYQRQDYVNSMIDGRAAQETRPGSKAAQEIEALCNYLIKQLGM